jgi:DNA-binding transcriptional MerR regulator
MGDFVSVQEAAELLGVQVVTLYRWRRDGVGPPWERDEKNKVVYRRSYLELWHEQIPGALRRLGS